jgi:peptide/nickel transport system ATP-binding protein
MSSVNDSRASSGAADAGDALVRVRGLKKWFTARGEGSILSRIFGEDRSLKAVDDVSFDIERGEILGLAGQSGCGKSTLGELLVGLQEPTDGDIYFEGENVTEFGKTELRRFRRNAQVIFQDPYESLNPRFSVARTVAEPLAIHQIGDREERNARTRRALEDAGLTPPGKFLDQLPGDLSGGQRQRVCIARALVLDPEFIVADEPVSMLDVSVRTGILNLFGELREERDLTMLYVSHDLSTINYLTDRSMIMYLGNVVEAGSSDQVIHNPAHPYTEALLESVPDPDPDQVRPGNRMGGDVPDPVDLPEGCRFHPRCAHATEECYESEPALERRAEDDSDGTRTVACYNPVSG